jgi:hypothetical protein
MESALILVSERGPFDRIVEDDQSDKDNGERGDDVGDHGGGVLIVIEPVAKERNDSRR